LGECGIVAATDQKITWEEGMHRWSCVLAVFLLAQATPASAEERYPSKPIRAIASQGPGGLSDVFMRVLAEELRLALGEPVVVENRTGAGGTIGARACSDSPPDGYTICIISGEAMVSHPIVNKSGFDPLKTLLPVTRLFYLTQVFAVNTDLGVASFDELAALARAKPKTLSYMAPSLSKVAFMEDFNRKNGTDFVRVPFKGGGDAVNSMLSGATPISVIGIGNVMQLLRDGRVRGLAVDGDQRSPLMSTIPTFREQGFNDYVMAAFFGISVPAGTPRPIIDRLNREIVKVASRPEFQQRHIIGRGMIPVLDTPENFAQTLQIERTEALKVVKASGLYPEIQ